MFSLLHNIDKKQQRVSLLNEDIKNEDVKRIEKMTNHFAQLKTESLTNSPIEMFIMQVNLTEFFQVMQLLETQRELVKTHQQTFPLVRERIEPPHSLTINDFKDYVDKAKKIHQKLNLIQEFQPPKEIIADTNSVSEMIVQPEEFQNLINYLKQQHDYLFEREQLHQKLNCVVQRCEQFFNVEYKQVKQESSLCDSKEHVPIKIRYAWALE